MRFESSIRSTNTPASLPARLLHNSKRVAAFAGLLVIAGFLLNALNGFLAPTFALFLQTVGFLGLGYLHFLILRANVTGFLPEEKLWYSLLLAAVVALSGIAFLFLSPKASVLTAFTGACTFLLPFILDEAWRLFLLFSTQAAATWRYSTDVSSQKATTFLNSLPVRFEIYASQFRGEYTVSFKAPVRMKLGTIFYHMVQEQNGHEESAIDLADREGQPYDWAFSTSVFGWKNFLDPELTLLENGVKENAIVIAERVNKGDAEEELEMENG